MLGMRTETDSLGAVEVPAEHLWGAQTQRALADFPAGLDRFRWGRPVIRALAIVKKCAALANRETGTLSREKSALIVRAAQEVIDGFWDAEFPLAAFQSGSGTQSNMNANEVIANLAIRYTGGALGSNQPVHPNDDVNCSQSTNDVFPSAMNIAIVEQIEDVLMPAVTSLRDSFLVKSLEYFGVVMLGRTHLQDAVPITLGQIASGWASQLDRCVHDVRQTLTGLYELAIGATAVGTGLNAPAGFSEAAVRLIAAETGQPFIPAVNKFAATSAHDAIVAASGSLRTLAGALMKIANDLRWYASGPRAGIGELLLPENEPGSSIMPGKINPTQCEAMTQVAVQVFGNDHAVAFAGSQGNFQLNAYKPVMLHNVLCSVDLLASACSSFEERCVRGLRPNRERIQQHVASSLMLVTALSPHIGYEKAARIAQTAHNEECTLRESALKSGYVTEEQFDQWVNAESMTGRAG
jgi:fumarate hydratase class II